MPDNPLIYFNGVNGATGDYLTPPMPLAQLAKIARGERLSPEETQELKAWRQLRSVQPFPVKEGVDPDDLAQAGWGVIFAFEDGDAIPAIKEALAPLLALRREQAGDRYREFVGPDAYRPGETKRAFLERHGVGPGPVDPDVMPYYLLIVGSPERIPFRFQYQLDVQFAVGRIHFDALDGYAAYAQSVAAAANGAIKRPRRAAFFGVRNPGDPATKLGADELVQPLAQKLAGGEDGWRVDAILAEEATKARLARLMGGDDTPAILFTESHGMAFPKDDLRQPRHQGALLCQDWPGPRAWGRPITEAHYFSADDLSVDANPQGLITFHFACFSAGTPRMDDFSYAAFKTPEAIAPKAFLAPLLRSLTGHPKGGALAAIGHVERAWAFSFMWGGAGRQIEVFNSALRAMMAGRPVGAAMDHFNLRYAELATDLSSALDDIHFGAKVDDADLAGLWTAHNDARSYIIVGDPAVRVAVAGDDEEPASAPIEITTRTTPAPTAAPLQPSAAEMAAVADFGLMDDVREAQRKLVNALETLANRLGEAIQDAVSEVSALEVKTFVSDDLESTGPDGKPQGKLRAYTRIEFDGDTVVYVPERRGAVNERLWQIHMDTVKQAQENRNEMLKAAVAAAASLLDALKTL